MAARKTIERVLRDDDDASGQSVRKWTMQSEAGNIMIKLECGEGFILLRPADVDQFVRDLSWAKDVAEEMSAETA